MSTYRRDFDKTKCMSFLIKYENFPKKYNEIWEKVSNIIKNEFDSNPAYKEKYIKTKIKSCNEKMNTNFFDNKIPEEVSKYFCLSVI